MPKSLSRSDEDSDSSRDLEISYQYQYRNRSTEEKPGCSSTFLLALLWISLFTLTPCYIWTFLLILKWSSALTFTAMYTSLLLHLFSLALGCGFVPCALPFHDHWSSHRHRSDQQHSGAKIMYTGSLLIAFGLSCATLGIINVYKEPTFMEHEYNDFIQKSLDRNYFPHAETTDIFEEKCCGWNGPEEFSSQFKFNLSRFMENGKFGQGQTDNVSNKSKCYDSLFPEEVTRPILRENIPDFETMQKGCGGKIQEVLKEACNFITISCSLTLLLTGITIIALIVSIIVKLKPTTDELTVHPQRGKSKFSPSTESSSSDTTLGEPANASHGDLPFYI